MKQIVFLTATLLFGFLPSHAQDKNPFQSIGKKGKVLTLSNGAYDEFFDQQDVQQIGTALVNIRTMKVVKLLDEKQAANRLDNTTSSRFLSIDPLTATFPMLAPYQYANNCPIAGVDLDGLEFYFAADGSYLGQSKNGGTQIRVATEYNTFSPAKGKKALAFTKYKEIDKVDPNIASKVFETIFRREVGNEVTSIAVLNETDRPSFGGHTAAKGQFALNMGNVEGGEKLNTDYYNAAATLFHEDKHSKSLPQKSSDGFSHFKIQKQTVQNSGLYEKTSANFKSFVKDLFTSYLDDQVKNLQTLIGNAHNDPSQTYSATYYFNEYQNNVQYFNKQFGEKMQEYDFKTFEKTVYGNDQPVIK